MCLKADKKRENANQVSTTHKKTLDFQMMIIIRYKRNFTFAEENIE